MCQKIPRLGGLAFYPAILIAYWVMRGLLSLFDSHLVGLPVEEMLFFFCRYHHSLLHRYRRRRNRALL